MLGLDAASWFADLPLADCVRLCDAESFAHVEAPMVLEVLATLAQLGIIRRAPSVFGMRPPGRVKWRMRSTLLGMALLGSGCGPMYLNTAPFSQQIPQSEMDRIEEKSPVLWDRHPRPDTVIVEFEITSRWRTALLGFKRDDVIMPPALQPDGLARLRSECGLTPDRVFKAYPGVGGGWARIERNIRRYADFVRAEAIGIASTYTYTSSSFQGSRQAPGDRSGSTRVGPEAEASFTRSPLNVYILGVTFQGEHKPMVQTERCLWRHLGSYKGDTVADVF